MANYDPDHDSEEDSEEEDSPIGKLFQRWYDEQDNPDFNETDHLLGLCECLERELTAFWRRVPDPFDCRKPTSIPAAGTYAGIYKDLNLKSNMDFVMELLDTLTTTDGIQNELILRFLCSVIICTDRMFILNGFMTKDKFDEVIFFGRVRRVCSELFLTTLFELAMSEGRPHNVYSTFILGHIALTKVTKPKYQSLVMVVLERLRIINDGVPTIESQNLTETFREWNLSSPMKKSIEETLFIIFLRRVALSEEMQKMLLKEQIMPLLSSWIHRDHHDNMTVPLEALKLFQIFLTKKIIYTEFNDPINGVLMLLDVPISSMAADAVCLCLYNLLCFDEIVDKVVLLPPDTLTNLIKVIIYMIKTCHPSGRSHGMLCVQYLIKNTIALQIFEELEGPRIILKSLDSLPNHITKSDYWRQCGILKATMDTMKACLEQSLIKWSLGVNIPEVSSNCTLPRECQRSFTAVVTDAIPLAIRLQTWEHPYLSDRTNLINVIYSSSGLFETAFTGYLFCIPTSLDILSLLCLSDKFLYDLLDFQNSDTKKAVESIFCKLVLSPYTDYEDIEDHISILSFLSILCGRCGNIDPGSWVFHEVEKVHINNQRGITKISSLTHNADCVNEELQTRVWRLLRDYNILPKLLKVLEIVVDIEEFSVCTWICHVLTEFSRCGDIHLILRKLSIFRKGRFVKLFKKFENECPEDEFCVITRRLIRDLPAQLETCLDQVKDKPFVSGNVLSCFTKRQRQSSSHSYNRMLQSKVHRHYEASLVVKRSDIFPGEYFSNNLCFAKHCKNGVFLASNSSIMYTDLSTDPVSVKVGDIDFRPSNLENSKDGKILLVSSVFDEDDRGVLTLLDVESSSQRHEYPFSGYTEFSKTNDRCIISQRLKTQIVDVETGVPLFYFQNEFFGTKKYTLDSNRATFNYEDTLILSSGRLWDVRCPSRDNAVIEVYKCRFDYLGDILSGVFHPNGREVIIGCAVWDIRSCRLLHDITSLKTSRIIFNTRGDFFYTYLDTCNIFEDEGQNIMYRNQRWFNCYDARSYNIVTTVETKLEVSALDTDPEDFRVAVIEMDDLFSWGIQCSVFDIGLKMESSCSECISQHESSSTDEEWVSNRRLGYRPGSRSYIESADIYIDESENSSISDRSD